MVCYEEKVAQDIKKVFDIKKRSVIRTSYLKVKVSSFMLPNNLLDDHSFLALIDLMKTTFLNVAN